ncbi:MAG: glycerol kinase, partial [Proteobacteria bacterium]|nr:glycerol kinase [Pseudomonadota bacterium]
MSKYILAIDQGTTSSRSILFDHHGIPVAQVSKEFRQIYPKPGWVEHDPLEIWESQLSTIRAVIEKASAKASDVAAVGITNQRETTILWDRSTGKPVYNAIVWQCRRTAAICDDLRDSGAEPMVLE